MTFQEMKEMLLNYPAMEERLEQLYEELKIAQLSIESIRETVNSTNITGMPKSPDLSDETCEKAQLIIDEYDKRISIIFCSIREIVKKLNYVEYLFIGLTEDESKVIKARYLKGLKWDVIPMQVNYSRSQCFRYHDRAIYKFLQKL